MKRTLVALPWAVRPSAFFHQVREGRIVPLIQFGGNAGNYWPELASAWQESLAARECIAQVARLLQAEAAAPEVVASGYCSHGFDILGWIADPAKLPPAAYLSSSIISQPLIFLTQVANILRVTDGTGDTQVLFDRAAGFLGHSQGVMTAVCFALGFPARHFTERVAQFALYFFWQGLRMQQPFPPVTVPADQLAATAAEGEGAPTPMAAIRGLPVAEADALLQEFNATLPEHGKIYRDLIHAWNWVVVGGPIASLLRLRAELKARETAWATDPILRRKVGWQYLPTSAPFHTPYMEPGLRAFRADLKRLGFSLAGRDLQQPVFATDDGRDLRKSRDVMDDLLRMEWRNPVHWPKVVAEACRQTKGTHVVDFGPAEDAVKLTGMNAEGRGVAVIAAATPRGRTILFAPEAEQIPWGEDWQQYRPRLVKLFEVRGSRFEVQHRTSDFWIDNAFTRFTKFPPIFGGGMTPTSVETEIVTAAANAGYLVEWAGGGQVTEAIWRERLEELRRDLQPGRGVIFNALFLDPYLWNLHYPKLIALKNEGYPILGLTISAGLPEVAKATEILRDLNAAGIWMNAFKPGSDAMIAHFLQIADANPQHRLLMHVEGGKAGGHHSWEDIRGLITRNYAKIRRRKNIILCVGGGIATSDEAAAWLLGTWQTNPDCPPMPVDAVFLGTRLMAVKEAKTSPQVKALLVKLAGTAEWVRKLEVKGGVTSQESQLGADVHFAENAAARAGALLDRLAGKPLEEILRHKAAIVALLNQTAKPYFGDLEQMTYGEVSRRMRELMAPGKIPEHLPHDGAWFDVTFRQRAEAWEQRRTARAVAETTTLHPEDVDYFRYLCRMPGKPVNFVPVIDENVRRWYKADSLWQAHDPRYPADAVYTIPGPEAVRGITKVDEPVAEVLGAFEAAVVRALGRPDAKAIVSYVGQAPSGWCAGAVATALTSEWIAVIRDGAGSLFIPNPIPRLFPSHDDPAVRSTHRQGRVVEVRTPGARLLDRDGRVVLELHHQPPGNNRVIPLRLEYAFHPDCGWAPLHAKYEEQTAQIAAFYGTLWGVRQPEERRTKNEERKKQGLRSGQTFRSETTITRAAIEAYIMAVGESRQTYALTHSRTHALASPLNMAIVHAWGAFAQCLLACGSAASLLDLLHLSNTVRLLNEDPIVEGDRLTAELTIDRIEPRGNGIVVGVCGYLLRGKERIVELGSEFFIRNALFGVRGSRFEVTKTNTEHRTSNIEQEAVPLAVPFDIATGAITAPPTAAAYARASHDLNPIHTDPRIAAMAGLEGPIMHGMWSSAALLREATSAIAQGDPQCLTFARTQFTQAVRPGESLNFAFRQIGAANGARVVEATLATVRGTAVTAQLHVREGPTAYLFTGQGSQIQGMGMEGYIRSAAARAIWDTADAFCRRAFGFSILHIVKENPRELLIRGERLKHPQGVLHLTQFTQVALTVLAMAQVAELKEAGCYDEHAMYAGHSLGEYAALSATGIIPLEQVVSVVYHRGLTMQHYVPRDAHGVSPYGMAVVRPNLVGLTDGGLQRLVTDLARQHKGRLEIVNFNIAGEQYSVTGETRLLDLLRDRLRAAEEPRGVTKPSFILLEGIDVPFHSTVLRDGVAAFRKTLEACIPKTLDPCLLMDRYVPNLIARPFRTDREYVKAVQTLTQSPVLARLLQRQLRTTEVTRTLLIELLAYQFASPVQWIATQSVLFEDPAYRMGRVIEIGPQPVLAGMAKRTLARMPALARPPAVLHVEQNRANVFYIKEAEEAPQVSDFSRTPVVAAASVPQSGTAPVSVTDEPLSIRDALWNLLALKLKLRPDEIVEAATIEKLSGGNSARRNEILADVGAEFNAGAIDDAQNKPLGELVSLLQKKVRYGAPGPYLRVATDQAIKGSLPIARKAIMEYLATERCLPEGRVLAVMNLLPVAVRAGDSLESGVMSPIGLSSRLSDETAARGWLDNLADWYGQLQGVTIPRRGATVSSGAAPVDAGAIAALEAKYFGKEGVLARTAYELLAESGVDCYAPALAEDEELLETNRRLALYTKELGPAFERVVTPLFDPNKALTFTGISQWVKRDVVELYWRTMKSPSPPLGGEGGGEGDQEIAHIANAADENTLATIRYFAARERNERRGDIAKVLTELERSVAKAVRTPAVFRPNNAVTAAVTAIAADVKEVYPAITDVVEKGLSLTAHRVLVTGAGPNSIGAEIVRNCLAAGAKVVVTTTTVSEQRTKWWRALYAASAGRNAELIVLPANQGNRSDMEGAVDWMVVNDGGIDACYPFGAVKSLGDLTTMGADESTATWRVLVQGVEWLIAAIARACVQHAAPEHRVAVILPLSPNHGQFGGDGAYSESKAALEVLFNRWRSEQEHWGKWITLMGPRIGWTRGTGLMSANDVIADALEKTTGCRTFSTAEMGFLLTALLHPKARAVAAKAPLRIDYTGGFEKIPDISTLARKLRQNVPGSKFEVRGSNIEPRTPNIETKTSPHYFSFPALPSAEQFARLPDLSHLAPKDVMVVVGYGEVSPYGNARTRWAMESTGTFSMEGCIELAWLMGRIRYEGDGQYVGWVDAKSGEPIADHEVKATYEAEILAHTGIRVCEPNLQGFDPHSLDVWGDVQLEEEFVIPVDSVEHGQQIIAKYAGQAELVTRDGSMVVRLKKGSIIKVARASRFPRYAAGQIPAGWDPTRYGIPKELVAQVDRNTLFNLIATAEAFLSAGCTPQELYDHFHPTRVGNTQGGGMGGMQALAHLYRAHREGQPRRGDVLQETLINVVAAWVTQSYVGSYGPTVHPVGACATAVVSLDTAVNLLAVGKADFVVAGGYDDYSAEGVVGFHDMEATADTAAMAAKGIPPHATSRPNDRRRGGFVEGQGGGTLLITRLDHAVRMGLPIYAVVGCVATHSDGIHTSIPAPGLGLLGMATGGKTSPLAQTLARFGLTPDDIAVVSKHDTSTKANDPNENQLHQLMQQAIGRTPGNPLIVHSQKAWLGHSKGGAGTWQANAAIQILQTGIVPGNPHLDDVDPAMAAYPTMCFTDRAIDCGAGNLRAVLFTSLGFGHVGAGALFIHPDFALRILQPAALADYTQRRATREQWYRTRAWEILLGKTPAYKRRTEKPYRTANEEAQALLEASPLPLACPPAVGRKERARVRGSIQ